MALAHLHQTVAVPGAFEFLRALDQLPATATSRSEVLDLMTASGIGDPSSVLADFLASNLLQRLGSRIGLSTYGIRTLLLIEAINGAELRSVFHRLGRYDATLRMYELVREGMTSQFLESIAARPGFSRLYPCSPWISLDARQQSTLTHALVREEARGRAPEVFVITRPDEDADTGPSSLATLNRLGATVFLNPRLHTKLYIREPDEGGGYSMAIVGSQNLTRSRYLELGIRINSDSIVIDQLIAYFWELTAHSREV